MFEWQQAQRNKHHGTIDIFNISSLTEQLKEFLVFSWRNVINQIGKRQTRNAPTNFNNNSNINNNAAKAIVLLNIKMRLNYKKSLQL
jgi:hypothetical protein